MNDQQLDEQIRSMVASAVAGAPPAPELPALHQPRVTTGRRNDRTGWYMAGAGIAAAAALVGVLVWANDGGDPRVVPATTIPVPTSAPVTVAPTVESTVPPTTVETTTPTTAPAPSGMDGSSTIITAGPDGVWRVTDGVPEQLVTEPMSMALQLPDGSVIMQRQSGWSSEGAAQADTTLLVWQFGELSELFPGEALTGWVRLYDVAMVNGEMTVLYAVEQEAQPQSVLVESVLLTRSLATFETTVIDAEFGGWEQGYSRMHLAEKGLIVGEYYQEVLRQFVSYSEVSQPGVSAADLGLESSYTDCSDCPRLYTISRDGSTIAWLDGTSLIRVATATDAAVDYALIDLGEEALSATDLELGNGFVVLSFGWGDPGAAAPVMIALDNAGTSAVELPGAKAAIVTTPTAPWEIDAALTAALEGQSFGSQDEVYAAVEAQIEAIRYAAVDPVEPITYTRFVLPDGSLAIAAPNFDDSVPETWFRIIPRWVDQEFVVVRIEFVDVCRNGTYSTDTTLCV
ncbi:MAG: hypothetical protein Q8M22_20360 [Actinomycetota bacterium]|nr:hypothetical protein [Actinomycetota bacterium]